MDDLDQIYRQHAQTVYKFLLAQCRNPDLAEELTQETFYQAVRSIHRFDGSCKLSVWLCQIAGTSGTAAAHPRSAGASAGGGLPAHLRRFEFSGDRRCAGENGNLGPGHVLPGKGTAEERGNVP